MIKKLNDHKYAKCHIVEDENGIAFVSYRTPVILIDKQNDTVICTGTYSQTTRKQIGWFLKEYMPKYNYYHMKSIVGKGEVAIADL